MDRPASAENPPKRKQQRRLRMVIISLSIVPIALVLFKFPTVVSWLKPENLQTLKEQTGVFAPMGFIIIYCLATIFAVPGTILTLGAGAVFGPFLGTLWTAIGATLGATGAFLIARFVVGDWAKAQFEKGDRLRRLSQGIEQNGFWFALSIRLSPIFPFIAVNYLLGLTPISLFTYILATAVGIIPGTFAYAWLGHGGLVAATGSPPWQLVGALAMLALLSALPIILKWIKGKPLGR